MGTAVDGDLPLLDSLREHVLSAIATATERVEHERNEVTAERHAYDTFRDRIRGIETVTTSASPATPVTRRYVDPTTDAVEQLRSAFRATVQRVDHYDEREESIEAHVASEFSPDIAVLFRRSRDGPFTEHDRTVLVTAIQRAIDGRDDFLAILDREQESLTTSRRALVAVLDEQDGPHVPDWYRSQFASKLDAVAEDRQQRLNERPPTVRTNGHDLCGYLYRQMDWTYPVLTALARFRRTTL
jgi:hypothetical protein